MRRGPNLRTICCSIGAGFITLTCRESPRATPVLALDPPTAISHADALSGTGYSMITSVRDLGAGLVMIADWRENRLTALDMETGTSSVVSRIGPGPGETQHVGWVYPYGRDSTLLTDAFSRRWIVYSETQPTRTIAADGIVQRLFGPRLHGVDSSGRVLGIIADSRRGDDADTLHLVLGSLMVPGIDTIAVLQGSASFPDAAIRRGSRTMQVSHPLRAQDQARLFADGWIAVAHVDPYRVDWRSPDGRWRYGDPLPVEVVPATDEEICFAVLRVAHEGEGCEIADGFEWPESLPPFILYDIGRHTARGTSALFADPHGRLVIRRTESSAHPGTRYDIVGRTGELLGTITLPTNEAIVGFGSESVYIIETDEVDLQTLRRHPWRLR